MENMFTASISFTYSLTKIANFYSLPNAGLSRNRTAPGTGPPPVVKLLDYRRFTRDLCNYTLIEAIALRFILVHSASTPDW